jgi:hypothetical protein
VSPSPPRPAYGASAASASATAERIATCAFFCFILLQTAEAPTLKFAWTKTE